MVGAVSPISYGLAPAAYQRLGSVPTGAVGGGCQCGPGGGCQCSSTGASSKLGASGDTDALGLTKEQQAQVEALKQRDREVRQHEAAHASAGGPYAGSPSFTYTTGPDGKRYATGGEVSIDTGAVSGDPAATIQKLRTVIAAALAPADPSGQDRAVAAQARAALAQAQVELTQSEQGDQASGEGKDSAKDNGHFARASDAYRETESVGASAKNADRASALVGLVA